MHLPDHLLEFVNSKVGAEGLYPNATAFVKDLIEAKQQEETEFAELDFSEMPEETDEEIIEGILESVKDIREGRYFTSTGDFKKDMEKAEALWGKDLLG